MKILTLDLSDLGKGIAVAVLTTIAARILPIVDAENLPSFVDMVNCAKVGAAAGIAYLCKNIVTNLAK